MSQLTIHEASKFRGPDGGVAHKQAIIKTFEETSPFWQFIPIMNLNGRDTLAWNVEGSLPTVSSRGYNENFGNTTLGQINQHVETMVILGGDVRVDEVLIDNNPGLNYRSYYEQQFVKSLSYKVMDMFINGDSTNTSEQQFDGLRVRLSNSGSKHLLPANLTAPSANGPLSLNSLDKAIIETRGTNKAIIVSDQYLRRLYEAARKDVGGQIRVTKSDFGYEVLQYAGLPIIPVTYNGLNNRVIDFNEAGPGGGTTSTSIYVVNLDQMEGVTLIQSNGIKVNDLGRMEAESSYLTRFYWQVGMAIMQEYAATRIYGITDAAIVT